MSTHVAHNWLDATYLCQLNEVHFRTLPFNIQLLHDGLFMPPVHTFKYLFVFIKGKYLMTHIFLEGSSILQSSHWLTEYKVQGPVSRSHLSINGDAKIIVDFTNVTILNCTVTLKWLTTLKQIAYDGFPGSSIKKTSYDCLNNLYHKCLLFFELFATLRLVMAILKTYYITKIMEWWHHCFCISEIKKKTLVTTDKASVAR